MNFEFLNNITETLDTIGKFIFESYLGTGILVAACLLLTFLIALILEFRTRDKFKNHPIEEDEEESDNEDE